jgi:hypothetical protein
VNKFSYHSLLPEITHLTQTADSKDSKVTSLNNKRTQQSDVDEKIKSELARLEVPLNTTLTKTIKSASVELVSSAIKALEEAMNSSGIQRPGGWLNKAIKDGWKPNAAHLPQDEVERDVFKKWFDLAYKQRLVLASTKGEDGQMYVYNTDGVLLPFDQVLAKYPLEKLKS